MAGDPSELVRVRSIVGKPLERIDRPGEIVPRERSGRIVRHGLLPDFRARGIEPVDPFRPYDRVRCTTCRAEWVPRRRRGRLVSRWWTCPDDKCNGATS